MPYDSASSLLLAAGIEALDSGITVFDAELRLVAVNQRFFQLMGIPPDVAVPGTSIEALFRYNAEHGEYGSGDVEEQVAQRVSMARKFAPHAFERERPDGRIVEVRGSPLPQGGFVTIYTDITVQRRRELALEQLRAELEQRVAQRTQELAHKTVQLQLVVDHITHGISLVNKDLQLELCNQQFLDIMRMPASLATTGREFADFIRFNAERGEYGAGDVETLVRERVELARRAQAHHFERVRPDGTAVEVIGTPTPGGGFVTTYIDITRRKEDEARLRASEQRFRDFASAATDWFFETDAQLRYTWFSERLFQVTGMRAESIIGKRRDEFVDSAVIAQEPEKWAQHLRQMHAHEPFRDFTYRQRDAAGVLHDFSVSAVPAFDDGGAFIGYRGVGREISDVKNAERALQASQSQLRAILDASPVGVALISRVQRSMLACNMRMAQLLGAQGESSLVGLPVQGACAALLDRIGTAEQLDNVEWPLTGMQQGARWALVSVRTMNYGGDDALLVWVLDVTELHAARESVQRMALHDPLTDLANRRYLQEHAQKAIDRAQRLGSRGALIYLDLDGFKAVNDRLGHQRGDALLVTVAQALTARLRRTDFLARVGGDEFAVLVESIPNDQDPVDLAQEMITMVKDVARTHLSPLDMGVGASAGVAYFGDADAALDDLLNRADAAMYRAKALGRGQVCAG